MDILNRSAVEISQKIRCGEVKVVDVVAKVLDVIKKNNNKYNSFITIENEDKLYLRANYVQDQINNGNLSGLLAGVPVAIKDNIVTKDLRTTCASKILSNYVPQFNAEVINKLENEGAIIIGKTNMDEFAMGSTSETSYYGPTRNPRNDKHVPGGSSGGSAAAVAANECYFALGSDTGGSIRQPASYCGVVGLKPTYGTVSRYGLIAYGSSLDQIGPIAKNVTDCATILQVIASYDNKDSTSVKRDAYLFTEALENNVKGIKVGIPRGYLSEGIDTSVKNAILSSAKLLEEQGAIVEEFDFDLIKYAIPTYYIIASAEASSNLARFDGIKYGYRTNDYAGLHDMYKKTRSEGFGPEVKRRIMLGSFVLSSGYYDAYYIKALKVKALIKQEFDNAFLKYDIILGPVAPTTAPEIGKSLNNPLKMYLSDIYTIALNLAGLPGISIPCGVDEKGLPIGLQLISKCFDEKTLIRTAYSFEQTCGDFNNRIYARNKLVSKLNY